MGPKLSLLIWPALLGAPIASGEPSIPQSGLVLWLDASDISTLRADATGRVERWADKSALGSHATQSAETARPRLVAAALGGRPALRFDGGSFLNLGRPESLCFQRGRPFTIVVVSSVAAGQSGTLLAMGGGPANQRAYQFYLAPGRIGSVVYGQMREAKSPSGPMIATLICDGGRAKVRINGRTSLSLEAGRGSSTVDVLVGARRENADNTGTFWGLTGDIAEMLVYNRALGTDELERLTEHLAKTYGLDAVPAGPSQAANMLAMLKTPRDVARLADWAEDIAELDDAAELLRSVLGQHPTAGPAVAETLMRIAEKNRLADGLAALAGELLAGEDVFTRGLAEWAIAMKVGHENNGQNATWPGEDAPRWFQAYAALPPAARVENDWVRQAASMGFHRDPARLLASVDAMIARAELMAQDWGVGDRSRPGLGLVAQPVAELKRLRGALSEATAAAAVSADLAPALRLWLEARRVMRDIALANPALDSHRLVFLKQFVPHTVRNITRSYCWKHKPGGDIYIMEDLRHGDPLRPLLDGRLGPGYVWGLDLWWDADRVTFGYARLPNWPPPVDTANYATEGTNVHRLRQIFEPLHVYECRLDGSAPVALTHDRYWSDFEPTYCANGDVVFASDRCGRAAECGNDTYDHTNPNLYLYSRRSGRVRRLTDSKDIDRYPHSLDDGRIAYTHWEYQERHFMEVHALWTIRPDGSMSDALYKHHMRAPLGLRDTRSIPDSSKLVSIAAGHHSFAYGPVVIVDPTHGTNAVAGLSIVTPTVKPQEGPMAGAPVAQGGVLDAGGLYQTPWALSETCFLASYAYARPNCTQPAGVDSNAFALYLIDVYGNRELLYRDPVLSCTMPIPLKPRPRPPLVPEMANEIAGQAAAAGQAVAYVTDVYEGLPKVPRGIIKHLRIAQRVPWPFDPQRGQQDYIPGNAGTRRIDFQDWAPVRVIGTVPVEEDGSAHFTVPADTAIYFQALDERHMEVMRMRSFVSFKVGEVRGCRGCHESQPCTPSGRQATPLAIQRPPRAPAPPAWGAEKLLGYEWLVQPVLDRHCTSCHGAQKPDGGIDLSASRAKDGLLQSYRTLFGVAAGQSKPGTRVLVACSDRFSNADVTQPMQFGSHRSRLVRVLLDDPLHREKVRLGDQDWKALVTWVDANAPYYDGFLNKRPGDGGPPRREVWVAPSPLAAAE